MLPSLKLLDAVHVNVSPSGVPSIVVPRHRDGVAQPLSTRRKGNGTKVSTFLVLLALLFAHHLVNLTSIGGGDDLESAHSSKNRAVSSLDRFITLIDQTEERVPAAQRRFSDEVLWFVLAVVEAVRLVRSAFLNGKRNGDSHGKKRKGMAVRVKCWAIASRSGTTGAGMDLTEARSLLRRTSLQKGEEGVTKRKEPMSIEEFRRRCEEIDKMPEGTRGGALAELVAEDMSNMNREEQKEFLKEFLEHLNPQDRQSLLTALGMGPVN